jgi:hypothetical protein
VFVEVTLKRDGVLVTLTQQYYPNLWHDYMIQAREMAYPLFSLGYHLVSAKLVEGGTDESTKTKQAAKKGNTRKR